MENISKAALPAQGGFSPPLDLIDDRCVVHGDTYTPNLCTLRGAFGELYCVLQLSSPPASRGSGGRRDAVKARWSPAVVSLQANQAIQIGTDQLAVRARQAAGSPDIYVVSFWAFRKSGDTE